MRATTNDFKSWLEKTSKEACLSSLDVGKLLEKQLSYDLDLDEKDTIESIAEKAFRKANEVYEADYKVEREKIAKSRVGQVSLAEVILELASKGMKEPEILAEVGKDKKLMVARSVISRLLRDGKLIQNEDGSFEVQEDALGKKPRN